MMCPNCKGPMVQLFTSLACKAECDLLKPAPEWLPLVWSELKSGDEIRPRDLHPDVFGCRWFVESVIDDRNANLIRCNPQGDELIAKITVEVAEKYWLRRTR